MNWKAINGIENFVWVAGLVYYIVFISFPHEIMNQSLADDPMSASGFGFLLIGILAAKLIQNSFLAKVALMKSSGAIQSQFSDQSVFTSWFHKTASKAFVWIACTLIPLALIGIYYVDTSTDGKWHLLAGSFLGVWMISTRFAYGVATGISAAKLSSSKSVFVLSPSHPDRSSGFGHLGYFYFEQALVLLLPSIYMISWIVLVSVNMGQLAQSELVENLEAAIEKREPRGAQFNYVIDQYVACSSGNPDVSTCKSEEREFIWFDHFIRMIAFNLVIFMLIWILPSIYIYRKMKEFRRRYIDPMIAGLEKELLNDRVSLFDAGREAKDARTSTKIRNHHLDPRVESLAAYRSTPTFPIPLWTAVTTWVSNVSAILGLLSIG